MLDDKFLTNIKDAPEVVENLIIGAGVVLVYVTTSTLVKRLIICRDYDTKHIKRIRKQPELIQKYHEVNLDRINNEEYKDALKAFSKKMIETLPKSNLINFYNNINKLKISKSIQPILIRAAADYEPVTNEVQLGISAGILIDTNVLFHELMHMASSIYKNGVTYTGFSQRTHLGYSSIGMGLTEGYTQLLTERIFGIKPLYEPYLKEMEISQNVEKIIGKDKMQELFFNADLKGLVKELGKYSSEQEALAFIKKVDFITQYETRARIHSNYQTKLVEEANKDVYKYLLKIYKTKQEKYLKEGIINQKEFINRIASFIYDIKLDKYQYNAVLVDKKDRKEVINAVLTDERLHSKVHQKLFLMSNEK